MRSALPLNLMSSPFQMQLIKEGKQLVTHDEERNMTLPELNELLCELNTKYKHLDIHGGGHYLIIEPTPWSRITELEGRLNLVLPKEFVELTTSFRFGPLSLGCVCFTSNEDYFEETYVYNMDPPVSKFPEHSWWLSGSENRPRHLIYIACIDPHEVLLDVDSGNVLAYCLGEETWRDSYIIADDFALFVRGAANAALMLNLDDPPNRKLAKERAIVNCCVLQKFLSGGFL